MTASPHVVGRVGALLRAVAQHEPEGSSTSAIARHAALPRATAHRLLTALLREGLVDRSPDTGDWVLGPELFFWSTAARDRYDVTGLAQPSVRRLAEITQESAFFSARRGEETICLLREDGSFPIRSFVLYEGVRFPLGVASAGLVILAHQPQSTIDAYLSDVDLVADWGEAHAPQALRRRIASTRRHGYAVNPGLVVEGSWGMGAAVFNAQGEPAWALSLTGVESRFTAARLPELGELLLREAHRLGREIAASAGSDRRTR